MARYTLGLDAGTSGLKALLIDERGAAVGSGAATYSLRTPRPGWAESNPEEWWQALCAATRQALAAAGITGADIGAIGFSGQMHTLVLLDETGQVVRPAISWADARGAEERPQITRAIGAVRLIEVTGSPAVTAFTATKLLWVRDHESDIWARARHALLAKDYLRWRLTGASATDPTDAGATGLLDLHTRRWSPAIVEALGLPSTLLPPIVESNAIAGAVTTEAAEQVGLRAGTPVACGAGDQECAALGCGIADPGPLLITLGSGGQVFAVTSGPAIDPLGRMHALPHALPNRWHLLAAIPAAGLALTWLRELLGTHGAPEGRAGTTPPLFVPSVAGERTPSMDESATGAFVGLNLAHTTTDLLFAAREGVAFALRACVAALADMGVATDDVRLTGGLSADAALVGTLSNVLNRPLRAAAQREGSAYGAALLGSMAVGEQPATAAQPATLLAAPDEARVIWHARRYEIYRRLCDVPR